ncbi:MAG TPA: carboxymuconolactone decarboxylase family protein [Streptosporangiaceae bacterium]|nr:carboxymuconolactone decarboxylase family protein [Streptosporangiaceae bacterium]
MARLPDVTADDDIAGRIRARRGGELRPLDRMLLHSPPVADGWNQLMGAIRGQTTVPAGLRELVILRIAVLNDAPYEWDSHQEPARRAGLTGQQLAAIRAAEPGAPLTDLQQLVIAGTDAMTRGVRLPEPLFDRLRGHLSDRQVFELVTTVAAYNMVSRLVVALDISSPAAGA